MVNYTYLGHACFLLDDGEYKVLVDPFLTGNPLAAAKAEDISCDYILVSHGHGDHLGDAGEIAKRTGAMVKAIPEIVGEIETSVGEINGCGMNLGGTVKLPFGTVKQVVALHSSGIAGGIACGFIIKMGDKNIYFSGDTSLFGDMKIIGEQCSLDYALLPIGGHYTMDIYDAATAAKWLGAKNVIPVHYNTWPPIEANPNEFKKIVESSTETKVQVVNPGEVIELK